MQAWGSLAGLLMSTVAVIFTGLLFRHEIRVRREEKRDAEAAQARLVLATLDGREKSSKAGVEPRLRSLLGGEAAVGYKIMNFSGAPVLDVMIRHSWSGGSKGPTQHIPVLIGEQEGDLRLSEDIDSALLNTILWSSTIEIIFTDANGQKWRRVDRNAPERLVERQYVEPSIVRVAMIAVTGMMAAALLGGAVSLLFR